MNFENGTVAIVSGIRENVMNGRTSIASIRFAWIALAVAFGLTAAGCTGQKPGAASGAAVLKAAPPRQASLLQCGGVDVHTKHVNLDVGCATCHPCGGAFGFDVPYTFTRGTTTAGGTLTVGVAPAVTTCTVACHSPMGAPLKTVAWNAGPRDCVDCHLTSTLPPIHPAIANPTPTGADCLACHTMGSHTTGTVAAGGHPAGWMDTTSPSFHAYSANAGISSCQSCHGVNLDGVGGTATTSCATCHGANWKTNCTFCHGGTANLTGAPPKGTWGYRTDPARIGAHTKHVTAGAISGAVACVTCHVVPADAVSPGHLDGPSATVAWGGIAGSSNAAPAWNRATGTCASTYCHGGYSGTYVYDFWGPAQVAYAGSNGSPKWTDPPMTCTSCHANPPLNGNWHDPAHGGGSSCNLCHPHVNATGTAILNPALHVNGIVEVKATYKTSCFGCH